MIFLHQSEGLWKDHGKAMLLESALQNHHAVYCRNAASYHSLSGLFLTRGTIIWGPGLNIPCLTVDQALFHNDDP